jgi:hypothetical protein
VRGASPHIIHCLITPPQPTCAEITASPPLLLHTYKRENKIFLKYVEIQMASVAKSRKGSLKYEEMLKYLTIYGR